MSELLIALAAVGIVWFLYQRKRFYRHFQETEAKEPGYVPDLPAQTLPQAERKPLPKRANIDAIALDEQRESIRHGHIILDWLRNIQISGKSVEELVDTGTPTEKAAMQTTVKEAVTTAKNYMERALKTRPDLKDNPKIREAQEAVEVLEHTIKLLAALEKPISASQGMQISSDISQMPPHLDQAAKEGVDKLMDRLKGGVAEANSALEQAVEQQEEGQRQAQEEEMAEQAAMEADPRKRRRRRRRPQRSSVSVSAKKISKDIRADDYALGQGAHAGKGKAVQSSPLVPVSSRQQPARQAPPQAESSQQQGQLNSLSSLQLDAIKELGKTLAQSADTAKTLTPAELAMQAAAGINGQVTGGSTVSLNDKLSADEQALSAQEQIKREREQRREQRRQNRDQRGDAR